MICTKNHIILEQHSLLFLYSEINSEYDETNKKFIIENCRIINIGDGSIFNMWIPIAHKFQLSLNYKTLSVLMMK